MKTFSSTDIAAMTEAAKFLGLGQLELGDPSSMVGPGEEVYEVTLDGFILGIEEIEREEPSLSGNRMRVCVDYVVHAETTIPGTRWDPPCSDYNEVARVNSPLNAIGAIAAIVRDQQILNVLEGCYWTHYHVEEPECVWGGS